MRESEIIVASTQTPFNVNDDKQLVPLIDKVEELFAITPKEISADKAYGSVANRSYLKDNSITTNIQFYDSSNIETQSFGIGEFEISQDLTHAKCPNGCISKTTTLSKEGTKLNMKFDRNDCQKCPF